MNAIKSIIAKFAARIPQAPAGGSSGSGGSGAITTLAILGLGGYSAYHSMVTIQPGHVALVYNRFGGLDEKHVLTEGLNFVLPWMQRAVVFDARTRPKPIDTQSGSKDLQMVQISMRVLYKPDPNNLASIYRKLGKDFDERVLPSIVNEVTKAVVAQYNASELLTKRNVVSKQIRDLLTERSADFHILLDDVAITHLAFSREYTAAVEAKQVAQQESERAKYIVDRALQEKKSIIIRAQGEAQAAQLIGNAIQKNPAFLELRKIEASKDIANTIVNSTNKVYLSADSLMINTLGQNLKGNAPAPAKASSGWM